MLDIMRRHKLFAISTFFQPPRNKTNVTYLPRYKTYKPSQLDYLIVINFRGHKFSRALIFAVTNFRELAKFAKISSREIFEIRKFAKISSREY